MWTTEKPTAPGWYWARRIVKYSENLSIEELEVVYVSMSKSVPTDIIVSRAGTEVNYRLLDFTHWIGPLEQPPSLGRE